MKEDHLREMDFTVLKRQLGEGILECVEFKREGKKAILKTPSRKAVIGLNVLDFYDIELVKSTSRGLLPLEVRNSRSIKENISLHNLRDVLNRFFHFSLKMALEHNDKKRIKELEDKAKRGKKIRIL